MIMARVVLVNANNISDVGVNIVLREWAEVIKCSEGNGGWERGSRWWRLLI